MLIKLFYLCVAAKNSCSHQNNRGASPNGSNLKFLENVSGQCLSVYSKYNSFVTKEVFKMWQNTRNCVNIVGVVFNNTVIRGYKTATTHYAAKSSPAQPGYVSEDKILQIKQHQNDFAQQYPSVTLILNKTMSDESRSVLEKWKQERIAEMGEEEFNRYYEGKLLNSSHPVLSV